MDKVILLLFAVFAVFQEQAAPELYNRLFRDEKLRDLFDELAKQPRERIRNDFFDEPAMSRERLRDDFYSSPLIRRGCVDFDPRACAEWQSQCAWSADQFVEGEASYVFFHSQCCRTCRNYNSKRK